MTAAALTLKLVRGVAVATVSSVLVVLQVPPVNGSARIRRRRRTWR